MHNMQTSATAAIPRILLILDHIATWVPHFFSGLKMKKSKKGAKLCEQAKFLPQRKILLYSTFVTQLSTIIAHSKQKMPSENGLCTKNLIV